MLYFSLSEYLEWVIISYIAVLSYLEQSKGRVIYTLYIDCMVQEIPPLRSNGFE